MKIIKKGSEKKNQEWWVGVKVTCRTCGCIYQLEESDELPVKIERHPQARPSVTTMCPTCGNIIDTFR